jgi:hypothetical protein
LAEKSKMSEEERSGSPEGSGAVVEDAGEVVVASQPELPAVLHPFRPFPSHLIRVDRSRYLDFVAIAHP